MVLDELAAVRPDLAGRAGLVIETTLDATLQRTATRSLRVRLGRVADRGATNGAVVVVGTADGAVLVLVGSADFADEAAGQVNMALAPRQPGSAMKPLLYAAAFERGYTAASMLLDIPTSFQTPIGVYTPENFDHRNRGPVPLRTALASSLNVPAVRTLADIGPATLVGMAQRAGLSDNRLARAVRAVARAGLGRGAAAAAHRGVRGDREQWPSRRDPHADARARRRDGRGALRTRAARALARHVSRARVPARRHPQRPDRARAGLRGRARYWRRRSRRR